jgi:hypothetical protein
MKTIHHLKTPWLILAMLAAVVVGEFATWYASRLLNVRFPPVAVGAVCVGLVAAVVAWCYDGNE